MQQNQKQKYESYLNMIISAPITEYQSRRLKLVKLLGQGGEGGVFQAIQLYGDPNIKYVALKLKQGLKEQEKLFYEHLISYQRDLEKQYPQYIIKIYDIFTWNDLTAIVMELGAENLYEYPKNKLNLIEKGNICKQILKSLQMLHNIGYAHRDIKPENYIKVGEDWKLCDFGLTVKHNQDLMTKNIGSILYTAPEVLTNNYESYTEKIDVWSIGCLMYEIIQGVELFQGNNHDQVKEAILTSYLVINSKTQIEAKIAEMKISEVWKEVLINMLQYDHTKRPSIEDVIQKIFPISIVQNCQMQFKPPGVNKEINPNFGPFQFKINTFQSNFVQNTQDKQSLGLKFFTPQQNFNAKNHKDQDFQQKQNNNEQLFQTDVLPNKVDQKGEQDLNEDQNQKDLLGRKASCSKTLNSSSQKFQIPMNQFKQEVIPEEIEKSQQSSKSVEKLQSPFYQSNYQSEIHQQNEKVNQKLLTEDDVIAIIDKKISKQAWEIFQLQEQIKNQEFNNVKNDCDMLSWMIQPLIVKYSLKLQQLLEKDQNIKQFSTEKQNQIQEVVKLIQSLDEQLKSLNNND